MAMVEVVFGPVLLVALARGGVVEGAGMRRRVRPVRPSCRRRA